MPYKDVMDLILPPTEGRSAHITGHYGEVRAKGPHGGSDFNYVGGQAGINLTHPSVHSPVSGEVIFVGGHYGTVTIRDTDGNEHKLLHMDTQTVRLHQHVSAGDQIGTMGGRGPGDRNHYAQHVHYQMKGRDGHAVNPESFWRERDVLLAPDMHQTASASSRVGSNSFEPVLEKGSHGPDVQNLQQSLQRLGYTGRDGQPLEVDGDFGANTEFAVRAFQRAHHLQVDGRAGHRQTLPAIDAAAKQLLTDASHPQHGLYAQALDKVHAEEARRHVAHGPHSERLAGSMAVAAMHANLTRIDRVELNAAGTLARAVQVSPVRDEPALNRTTAAVDTHAALRQSLQASSQQAREVLPLVPAPAMTVLAMKRAAP
jgi:putative chitinase